MTTTLFHYAEHIKNFNLPNNYVLALFDVVNLYSNISKDLVNRVIQEKWQQIGLVTNIQRIQIIFLGTGSLCVT